MSHAETTGETRAGHVTSTPGPLPENTDAVTLYLNEEAAHSIAAALAKADEEHDFGDPPDWLDDARAVIAVLAPHLASLLSAAREAGREEGRTEERERIEQWLRDLADKAADGNPTEGSAARSIAADIRWAANRLADEFPRPDEWPRCAETCEHGSLHGAPCRECGGVARSDA